MLYFTINPQLLLLALAAFSSAPHTSANSVANATQVNFEQALSAKLSEEDAASNTQQKSLLSRKRRYLLFPEGSSFQLVYDEIIGVVDYTNYLILGITVALAWELPSKPPSEMLDELRTNLQEGNLIGITIRNDSVSNIKYFDVTKPTTHSPAYIKLAGVASGAAAAPGGHSYYYTQRQSLPVFQVPMHRNYYYEGGEAGDRYYRPKYYKTLPAPSTANKWRRKDSYYYNQHHSKKPNPFAQWTQHKPFQAAGVKYPWWNLTNRLSNSWRGKPRPAATANSRIDSSSSNKQQQGKEKQKQQQQQQQQPTGNYQFNAARKHRIYPVFGKRSVAEFKNSTSSTITTTATTETDTESFSTHTASSESTQQHTHHHHHQRRHRRSGIDASQLSQLDRIHIRHHRSTRQSLYEKIEKYLDKRGAHGQHCVLRALCETGQKSNERAPSSFVGELMRTVFTLPESVLESELQQVGAAGDRVLFQHQRFDEANAYVGDCAARYAHCKDSLWMSSFIG